MPIEADICSLAQCSTVNESLVKMGLISKVDEPFSIVTISDWRRGGAETYCYTLDIVGSSTTRLILKACVVMAYGRSIDSVIDEWQNRRILLESQGVAVPAVYGYGNGVILEEFISYDIEDVIKTSRKPEKLALELGRIAAVFIRLGFRPNQVFLDFRSRGSDVVIVDFGEDLGPSGLSIDTEDVHCVLRHLTGSLGTWCGSNGRELQEIASRSFWKEINFSDKRKG
jgi:hypothetical protein